MRILVVSDTHRRLDRLEALAARAQGIDLVFHLGDSEGQMDRIRELFSCPVLAVRGNCDWFQDEDEEIVTTIGGTKFLLIHGHKSRNLFLTARQRGASIVCCGHSHRPLVLEDDGILLVNPGSLTQPRQESRIPTYAMLNQDSNGRFHATIVEYEERQD